MCRTQKNSKLITCAVPLQKREVSQVAWRWGQDLQMSNLDQYQFQRVADLPQK